MESAPVPVAWVRGEGEARTMHLSVALTEDPSELRVHEMDRPIDGLRSRPRVVDHDTETRIDYSFRPVLKLVMLVK